MSSGNESGIDKGNSAVRAAWITATAAIVAAIITGLFLYVSKNPSSDPTAAPSLTNTSPSPQSLTPPAAPSESVPKSVEQNGTSLKYLADIKLDPSSPSPETGVSTIGGNKRECGKSLLFSLNTFQDAPSVRYDIPAGWTTFTTTLGLDNKTRDGVKAHFEIYLDDEPINAGYTLDLLSIQEISVPVSGKSYLTLKVAGVENGGGTGRVGNATWCDARFTK